LGLVASAIKRRPKSTNLSKQYDFGMIFFAALGAVLFIMFDGRSNSDVWLAPVLSLSLMLFACGNTFRGRKMVSRIKNFHDRFGSWQIQQPYIQPTLMG
jgi:hypothetical protein